MLVLISFQNVQTICSIYTKYVYDLFTIFSNHIICIAIATIFYSIQFVVALKGKTKLVLFANFLLLELCGSPAETSLLCWQLSLNFGNVKITFLSSYQFVLQTSLCSIILAWKFPSLICLWRYFWQTTRITIAFWKNCFCQQ